MVEILTGVNIGLVVINGLIIVANLLVLRGCMKMYTEYFKDRSMANRK